MTNVTAPPLGGLRVLNLSPTIGGAFVGQFFADFGADVTLVEPPGGSPLRKQAGWPIWSRGSKSIEATLDDPAVRALALKADLLVDTFRPGVLERHGLGHDELAKQNPRLVTVSITGFGRGNQLSHLKGYEGVVMAKVGGYGQMSPLLTRGGPAFGVVPYCAASAGELAITAALVALYEREKSGVGQHVETTLTQALAAHDTWNWMISFWARKFPEAYSTAPVVNTQRRVPNSWLSYGLLQGVSKDGRWMQFSQATPKLFRAFLNAAGLDSPEWEDAWQDEDLDRREAFWETLLTAVRSRTLAEWNEVFDAHPDVFAEVFRKDTELLHHPQLIFDDQVAVVNDRDRGEMRVQRPFVRLSKTPGSVDRLTPRLNEHEAELRRDAAEPAPRVAPADAPRGRLPLEGVTIVELGSFYAAPFGITLLTDLGARVLKIEQMEGDAIRFQVAMPEIGGVKVTQGKQSVAVDIQSPEGLAIVRQLLAKADLVLQSFRASKARKLGLDEASVRAFNPTVIYHEAPGFGTGGPYGHRPAYAPTIGAGSGLARRTASFLGGDPDMSLQEVKDTAVRLHQACAGVCHSDGFASLGVACGQALGLLARERGAGGQGVITTMMTTLGQILSENMIEYEGRPDPQQADTELHGFGPLYRLYPAALGSWVFLAAPQADEWQTLVATMPASAGLSDPRYATAEARAEHAEALIETLGAAFKERSAADWEALLTPVDVACVECDLGPSFDTLMLPGGLAHQLDMTVNVEHPMFGEHPRLKSVISFSRSGTQAGRGALIGEHTDLVLKEFGYSEEQLADLAARNVIGRG